MGFNEFLSSIFGNKSTRHERDTTVGGENQSRLTGSSQTRQRRPTRQDRRTESLHPRFGSPTTCQVEGQLKASVEDTELEKREDLFNQIDKIEKEILEICKRWTKCATAFSIVKETAKRFSENEEIVVAATDLTANWLPAKNFVRIEGDKAIYQNHWIAGGNDTAGTWYIMMYSYSVVCGSAT